MEKTGKTIIVTGATGQQGGAVTRHLLKNGWKVRAFVRDANKVTSQKIKESGAEIVQGDMNVTETIDKAMAGVYGVFSVQNFWEHGYEGELIQGKNVIDSAKKAGVKHFVYSSVGSSNIATQLPHFEVKWQLEQYLQKSGLNYTVIKPVFFMDNFNGWFKPTESDGNFTLTMAMKPDTKLQMVAVNDIGAIVNIVLNNPVEYSGKTFDIAGDNLTMPEVAEMYSKKLNKKAEFNELPLDILRGNSKELADMFEWFQKTGYIADITKTRTIYPRLMSFEDWLKS